MSSYPGKQAVINLAITTALTVLSSQAFATGGHGHNLSNEQDQQVNNYLQNNPEIATQIANNPQFKDQFYSSIHAHFQNNPSLSNYSPSSVEIGDGALSPTATGGASWSESLAQSAANAGVELGDISPQLEAELNNNNELAQTLISNPQVAADLNAYLTANPEANVESAIANTTSISFSPSYSTKYKVENPVGPANVPLKPTQAAPLYHSGSEVLGTVTHNGVDISWKDWLALELNLPQICNGTVSIADNFTLSLGAVEGALGASDQSSATASGSSKVITKALVIDQLGSRGRKIIEDHYDTNFDECTTEGKENLAFLFTIKALDEGVLPGLKEDIIGAIMTQKLTESKIDLVKGVTDYRELKSKLMALPAPKEGYQYSVPGVVVPEQRR